MPRVTVDNISDGGLIYWLLKLYAFAALALLSALGFFCIGLYLYFAKQVPPVPDLVEYARTAPGVTTLYAQDGTLLAELATERRELVPLARVPKPLVEAFLATEDRRFYSHAGVDFRGTLRALAANLRAGQVMQGGSTITQQVAKAFLSPERSWSRKVKEAIFARRLEARYTKNEIFALYLNHIFLGNGAYGVQAAARKYFDKEIGELDVGELALIAGLARAPSRYSPFVDEEAARERRSTVLDNMVETGALSKADGEKWKQSPLTVRARRDYFNEITPYFSEQVRRDLAEKYGNERWPRTSEDEKRRLREAARQQLFKVRHWEAKPEQVEQRAIMMTGEEKLNSVGYRVETTVLPLVDSIAQENVDFATRKLDKRQGWRGPEARLDEARAKEFIARAQKLYPEEKLVEGKLYLGLVEKVSAERALVRVGGKSYPLPLANMMWAARYSASDATNDLTIESATQALRKNDVVWVKWAHRSVTPRFSEFAYNEEGDAAWLPESTKKVPRAVELALEQTPRVQGAIYAFDHSNGYVTAMVGGDDFDRSKFNRITQSCRQPGSAYKPVYYSLALDRGYAYDTLWNDKPKAEVDPVTGELWLPQNIDGSYNVQVSLERALVWSKNPPSVEIFKTMGSKDVAEWHKRLGFTTPLITSPKCEKEFCSALALGASCVHIDDITRAFAVFAKNGKPIQPTLIRRVLDRQGNVVEDYTAWDDPWLPAGDKLDRVAATAGKVVEPVIDPRTAWLTSKLLREIVTLGHSGPIRATKVIGAGKTGTSSRTADVWFIGYTSQWMTTAWLGDDRYERQLGFKDASFMLTVPMWARFLYAAVGDQPLEEIPWERPAGMKANDTGGPLKKGFPLPPAMQPPDPNAPPPVAAPPPDLTKLRVKEKTVRVLGAPPRPPKPGEAPTPAVPAR